jgi:hypothetical protein
MSRKTSHRDPTLGPAIKKNYEDIKLLNSVIDSIEVVREQTAERSRPNKMEVSRAGERPRHSSSG